jgi:hypothetical protein
MFEPSDHLDEQVTIRGVAEDARAGAILMLGDTPIYIGGLLAWEDELSGKSVKASGTLRRRKSRIPKTSPDKDQYHGLGDSYVLEEATYALADAAST